MSPPAAILSRPLISPPTLTSFAVRFVPPDRCKATSSEPLFLDVLGSCFVDASMSHPHSSGWGAIMLTLDAHRRMSGRAALSKSLSCEVPDRTPAHGRRGQAPCRGQVEGEAQPKDVPRRERQNRNMVTRRGPGSPTREVC